MADPEEKEEVLSNTFMLKSLLRWPLDILSSSAKQFGWYQSPVPISIDSDHFPISKMVRSLDLKRHDGPNKEKLELKKKKPAKKSIAAKWQKIR